MNRAMNTGTPDQDHIPAAKAPTKSSERRPRRVMWGTLLVLSAAWIGLVAGTILGGRYFVPKGSGMAGPVIALSYGLLGLLIGLLIAGFMAWRAPMGAVRLTTLVAAVLALLIAGLIGHRAMTKNQQHRAKIGADVPLPEPETWTLKSRLDERNTTRSYRELKIEASDWSFEYIATGPESALCTGSLFGAEASSLSDQVAALADRLQRHPPPCQESTDAPLLVVNVRGANLSVQDLEIDSACLKREPELADLALTLRRIPLDAVGYGRVQCR